MKIRLVVLVMLGLVASSTTALALGKGTSMLSIAFTSGTADLAVPDGASGYLIAAAAPEVGGQAQFWNMMSEDYAFTLGAGLGLSNEKQEPGAAALPGSPDIEYSTSSWNIRIGGDRVVKVGDRAVMYGGPGLEYWSGEAKFDDGTTSQESEPTNRISLDARIGAIIVLSETVGINAHVGSRVGRASSEADGAKATWWASGFDGAMGITFMFGGGQ